MRAFHDGTHSDSVTIYWCLVASTHPATVLCRMHAWRGQPCDYPVCDRVHNKTLCTAVGGHAFSENGEDWNISPVIAYTPTQEWEDGSVTTFRARERPHLIFDSEGDPTHIINGVGDPCPGGGGSNTGCPNSGGDHTFTLVAPLGTKENTDVLSGK